MKITKEKLQHIIKEEAEKLLHEQGWLDRRIEPARGEPAKLEKTGKMHRIMHVDDDDASKGWAAAGDNPGTMIVAGGTAADRAKLTSRIAKDLAMGGKAKKPALAPSAKKEPAVVKMQKQALKTPFSAHKYLQARDEFEKENQPAAGSTHLGTPEEEHFQQSLPLQAGTPMRYGGPQTHSPGAQQTMQDVAKQKLLKDVGTRRTPAMARKAIMQHQSLGDVERYKETEDVGNVQESIDWPAWFKEALLR